MRIREYKIEYIDRNNLIDYFHISRYQLRELERELGEPPIKASPLEIKLILDKKISEDRKRWTKLYI